MRKKPDASAVQLQSPEAFEVDFSNYHITSNPYWKSFSNLKSDPVFYIEVPNATIISKGIVTTAKNEVVLESTIFQLEYLNELYSNHFVVFKKLLPHRKENKVFSLLNRLDNNYYHWTMESLSRVLVIYEHPAFKEYKILVKKGGSRFMFDSLEFLFNIPKERMVTKSLITRIDTDKALVVSFPHIRNQKTEWTSVYYPYLIRKLNTLAKKRIQEHLEGNKQNSPKNILISRKNALERRIVNEDECIG
ncbi:glycosyltransferase family 61 protein [Marixanthomonas spongiae]|uniref:Uncharacterized protein n=1 Tax=Marixanthomonas spongiae TaxID=2174845 RepID=A0A2U0I5A2_9FLAO|nr:hypothetical protein DDV96_03230 [Marixanthomonas spongiae]